ncbi:hypothetical protein EPO44_19865, partial [bacterium]
MTPEMEQELSSKLRWRNFGEIPNSPVVDFQDLVRKVNSGELFLAVNYFVTPRFTHHLFGMWNSAVAGLILIPFVTALALVPVAFLVRDYWLLGGMPLALLAMVFAVPTLKPIKKFGSFLGVVTTVAMLWWVSLAGNYTAAVIAGSYTFPFWAVRYVYFRNSRKLTTAALRSETLLLYLLQNGHAFIRDMRSGEKF